MRSKPSRTRTPSSTPWDGISLERADGLVQRLWSYCNVLRDDGLSYGDYLEQLTYLLFLKMADEQTRPPFSRERVARDKASLDLTWLKDDSLEDTENLPPPEEVIAQEIVEDLEAALAEFSAVAAALATPRPTERQRPGSSSSGRDA